MAGSYRATPVRSLETETAVAPLDLYLTKRVADFEARLEASGMGGATTRRLRRSGGGHAQASARYRYYRYISMRRSLILISISTSAPILLAPILNISPIISYIGNIERNKDIFFI